MSADDPSLDLEAIEHMALERDKRNYYGRALFHLVTCDRRWVSNYNLYQRWDDAKRTWWINIMEAQAAKGFPTAMTLMATATMMRMKS